MLNALRPLLLLTAFAAVVPAHAQDPAAPPAPEPQPRSQRQSAEDRVREVERDGGRVLQAEPMQRGGREVYRLKVLTPEGRVRVIHDGREPRAERGGDRFESARPGRQLRERQRDREPSRGSDERRSEPSPDAADRPLPRRAEGGRSGGRDDRH